MRETTLSLDRFLSLDCYDFNENRWKKPGVEQDSPLQRSSEFNNFNCFSNVCRIDAEFALNSFLCIILCIYLWQAFKAFTNCNPKKGPKRQILNKELSGKCQAVFSFFLFLKKITQYPLDIMVFLKTQRTAALAVRNTPLTNIPKGFSSKMTLEVV